MNKPEQSLLSVALFSALLLLAACQTTDSRSGDEVSEGNESSEQGEREATSTRISGDTDDGEEQADWEERLERTNRDRSTSGEKVDVYVQSARQHMRKGEYKKAREELQQALSLDPGHQEATELLQNVLVQLGELERGSGKQLLSKWESVKEQQQHITQVSFQEGKKAFENGNYQKAVNKFEETMSRLRYMPVESPSMKELKKETKNYLSDARNLLEKQEEKRRLQRQKAMQKMAEKEEFDRQQSRKKRVRKILEQARELFKQKKYKEVEQLLEEAEKIDPTVDEIQKLKRIAWRMRHRKDRRELARRSKREWRQTVRDIKKQLVGQSRIVEFPDSEKWEQIKEREPKGIRRDEEQLAECEQAIIDNLKNTQISIEFQETPLPSVLDFFRDRVGINIVLDRQNIPNPGETNISINLTQDQVSAYRGLQIVLGTEGLAFDFRECTLLITTQQAQQKIVFDMYQVKDLNFRLRNFAAPDFNLGSNQDNQSGAGEAAGLGGGIGESGEEEEQQTAFTGEQLVQLIQEVVSPESWQKQAAQVEVSNGLLLVRNTPEVHDQVLRLLENIRRSTGIIVTVEARFLEIRTNLLEKIGVEFADLDSMSQNAQGNSTIPGSPTINEFTGSPGPFDDTSPTGGPSRGIFGQNDPGTDNETLQGHSSHGFGPIEGASFQSLGLDEVLRNNAGSTLQFAVLNDISVNAIVNAVKQDSRSQQVVAPQLTLFNTQRGNVTVSRQIAYIKDVEPQTATDTVAPDPEIGVVNDNGFILDVRPIVSADRRYITMELRPTITDLIDRAPDDPTSPFQEFTTLIGATTVGGGTGGGGTVEIVAPVEATIQVPTVEQRRIRTTIAIPDGGTLMVGGMTSITDSTRKSEVPVLSDIPVAGFLGSHDESFQDQFRLIILVTGNITIMEDVENRRFSSSVNLDN